MSLAVTGLTTTSRARIQPLTPFGRSGSCTRYQPARHRAPTRRARTAKTLRAPFTLSSGSVAKAPCPGLR